MVLKNFFIESSTAVRSKKRMLFGVIAASVSDISQRELLLGIIEEAKKTILTLPLSRISSMKIAMKASFLLKISYMN